MYWLKTFGRVFLKFAFRMWLAHLVYTILLIWLPVYTTPTIIGHAITGTKIKKTWKPLTQISENLQKSVIAAEDQAFDDHFGFDLKAIEKAIEFNKTHTNRKKGASTISQQVAKNVFLWQRRDFLRKGLEAYCTFLIELLWSKDRILEVYLNVAEMGDGIYGAEAASQNYFKKPASQLSLNESALIAACLPNPLRFNPSDPSDYMLKRKDWIVNQVNNINWE